MTSKREAQRQARKLRRKIRRGKMPNRTVNVVEVSSRNWGVRFSPKGKRDTFDYRPSGVSRLSRGFSGRRRFAGAPYHLVGPARHPNLTRARKAAASIRRRGYNARIVKRKGGGASVYASFTRRR